MRIKILLIYITIFISSLCGESFCQSKLPMVNDRTKFFPKDFSYLLGKLSGIDDDLLKMHFTLYKGYVKNTNSLAETLQNLRKNGEDKTLNYGALKRRFGWEYDGMYLHELYFENLGGTLPLNPKSALYNQIVQDYGSYESWENDFKATGLIRGIGWVIMYQDPIEGSLYNVWINEHNTNHLPGGIPILVMDVWEHAYISQYGLNRSKYIDTFFNNINWKVIEDRYQNQ